MLDRLIGLLRATAQAGSSPATLGSQVDLVGDWLAILAIRMGPRLRWSIDVPDELRAAMLPPAVLQPLVENAIKHGLEPRIEGGDVDIVARTRGSTLELTVCDTGAGLAGAGSPRGSTALGLANLRARLSTLYGEAASLAIAENPPSGVRAIVRIPLARRRWTNGGRRRSSPTTSRGSRSI
jgi:LytS/YehU family sensor histidine kinase